MAKKTLRIVVLLIFVCSMFLLTGCNRNVSIEKHTKRISKIIERDYISSDGYTDYKLYPLYNESDEVRFFLVDFEPTGFFYVRINKSYNPIFHLFGAMGRYGVSKREGEKPWQRYRLCTGGVEPEPYEGREWKIDPIKNQIEYYATNRWETDENGEFIVYTDSPYKVANVQDEKMYLLEIEIGYKIPAVKRGDKFLNLISMEEIEYSNTLTHENVPCVILSLMPKKIFDL